MSGLAADGCEVADAEWCCGVRECKSREQVGMAHWFRRNEPTDEVVMSHEPKKSKIVRLRFFRGHVLADRIMSRGQLGARISSVATIFGRQDEPAIRHLDSFGVTP